MSSVPGAWTEFGHGGLDLRDPGQIEAPRLIHADTVVEIPQDTLFARHSDQFPRDNGPSQLLVHGVCGRRNVGRCAADRMVGHELSIGLVAKSLIPQGAPYTAVPGPTPRRGRRPDPFFFSRCSREAAQPLSKASLDDLTWLPVARLEHG